MLATLVAMALAFAVNIDSLRLATTYLSDQEARGAAIDEIRVPKKLRKVRESLTVADPFKTIKVNGIRPNDGTRVGGVEKVRHQQGAPSFHVGAMVKLP